MKAAVRLFGREVLVVDVDLTPPAPEKPAEPAEPADPSTYKAAASTPRLAETRLPPDPDPIDGFGFGFAPPHIPEGATT